MRPFLPILDSFNLYILYYYLTRIRRDGRWVDITHLIHAKWVRADDINLLRKIGKHWRGEAHTLGKLRQVFQNVTAEYTICIQNVV